jgi:hypothetical protein
VQIFKLGKGPRKFDARNLKLSKYIKALPTPPGPEQSWVMEVIDWPMFLNDQLGDCVIAGAAHVIQQWDYYSRKSFLLPTDQQVLKAYEDVGGYVPGDPNSDNGCNMLDALKYWRKTGIAAHKIGAFVEVDPKNLYEVAVAVWLFGNLYTGVALPISAQGQSAWVVPEGGTKSEQGQPGGWGGHCVPIMAVSPKTLTCITWGMRLKMSHNFFADYCEEAYAVLSEDWINRLGIAPSGFDFDTLKADLAQL